MSPCRRIRSLLSAYVDGELHERQRVAVGTHCRTCPACREVLDSYLEVSRQLRELDADEPDLSRGWDAALAARVAMLDEELQQEERSRARVRSGGAILRGGLALAASLLLGMCLGFWLSGPAATVDGGEVAGGLVEYEPSFTVDPELQDFLQDSYQLASHARQADCLPGRNPVEQLAFLRDYAEDLRVPERAPQVRDLAIQLEQRSLRDQILEVTVETDQVLQLLDRPAEPPQEILLRLRFGASELAEKTSSLLVRLRPGTRRFTVVIEPRESRSRQERLSWLAVQGSLSALDGRPEQVSGIIQELRTQLGAEHPYVQDFGRLWQAVAEARAGRMLRPENQRILILRVPDPRELRWLLQPPADVEEKELGGSAVDGRK
jgi:hypothetical protein